MWRCRLALLNWVMTKIRSMPACRLLLIGMSIRRNLPPIGTAGFARSRVSGQSRLPCPPPRIAVVTFSMELSPRPANAGVSYSSTMLAMSSPPLHWTWMGRVPYAEAVELQHAVRDGVRLGEGPERFLLLEHPHVYTLGRNADRGDVLAGPDWLRARGIEVAEC